MTEQIVDPLYTIGLLNRCSHACELSDDMEIAADAALAAAKIVRQGFGTIQKVESKGVGDLVCEVDRMADVAATEALRSRSSAKIMSEELSPDVDPTEGKVWIVDPLDASSSFLVRAGIHYPSVLIALVKDGVPQIGIALFPLTGEWFYAQRGKGAYKDGKRLVIDQDETYNLSNVWVEMNQYGDSKYETKFFESMRDQLRSDRGAMLVTNSVPSAGNAMRIAEGKSLLAAIVHDNNPSSVKQAAWDIAPIQVIFEEAGGVLVGCDGDDVNPFSAKPFVVAKSRSLAEQILDLSQYQPDQLPLASERSSSSTTNNV